MTFCTQLRLNICLFCEALTSDISSRNLKAMSKKEVKGLGDRLNIGMMLIKVLVCDPRRITVLWTDIGKLEEKLILGKINEFGLSLLNPVLLSYPC